MKTKHKVIISIIIPVVLFIAFTFIAGGFYWVTGEGEDGFRYLARGIYCVLCAGAIFPWTI